MPLASTAFWTLGPGLGGFRNQTLPAPVPGEVLVEAMHEGISRGTETLVFGGRVPPEEFERMRAPFQEGKFPGPVKYGYLSVGRVIAGEASLLGRVVFSLYPHQTYYVVPAASVVPVPDGVPARRAVLAGIVETAVNALWDAAPLIGDRIAVVGGGAVGCCLARLTSGILGTQVELYDVVPERAEVAARLGVAFRLPQEAEPGCDVVFHTSATSAGLQTALGLLADEGRVHELSWYGDAPVEVRLGGRFHSGRLGIVSSQVGLVSPARRSRRSPHERLALALELLRDDAFDALLTGDSPFADLPRVLPGLADGTLPAICHTITHQPQGVNQCTR